MTSEAGFVRRVFGLNTTFSCIRSIGLPESRRFVAGNDMQDILDTYSGVSWKLILRLVVPRGCGAWAGKLGACKVASSTEPIRSEVEFFHCRVADAS